MHRYIYIYNMSCCSWYISLPHFFGAFLVCLLYSLLAHRLLLLRRRRQRRRRQQNKICFVLYASNSITPPLPRRQWVSYHIARHGNALCCWRYRRRRWSRLKRQHCRADLASLSATGDQTNPAAHIQYASKRRVSCCRV